MSGRTELPSGLVTFMFTDIEGSTRLARMLGDGYRSVLNAHRGVIRDAVRNHSGIELFTEGDSFFVAFADAAEAVAACVASQRALADHPWPSPDVAPRVRMGLHTGWAQPVGGEYTSHEVHRAARVSAAAHGGQIICSEATALAVSVWSADLLPGVPVAGAHNHGRHAADTAGMPRRAHNLNRTAAGLLTRPFASAEPRGTRTPTGTAAAGTTIGSAAAGTTIGSAAAGTTIGSAAGTTIGLAAAGTTIGSVTAGTTIGSTATGTTIGSAAAGTAAGPAATRTAFEAAAAGTVAWEPARGPAASRTAFEVPAAGGSAYQAAARSAIDLVDLGQHRLRGFDDAERLFQIVAPGLQRSFPEPRTESAPVHNLPAALTSFVGRQAEVAELRGLVGEHRLVTVAGAGGAGKTRIALAVAEQVLAAYAQGVWVVDLAEGVPEAALAAAMGVRPEPARPVLESVVERCRDGRILLVLDTCDAHPGAVRRLVRRLLGACPRLDVLATSRAPLGVPGELVWRLPPMAPADAYALLSERSVAARGGRAVSAEESGDLGRVASKLDGHPLAIELAADRLRLLSAAQLAARLHDPIAALDAGREGWENPFLRGVAGNWEAAESPASGSWEAAESPARGGWEIVQPAGPRQPVESFRDRHTSLTRNLDCSYRALSDRAAALLRRLAVFAGPVELATVEWSGDDAFGALSELADRSLVEVVAGPRYRLGDQVRAYAARRLAAAGEERVARDRHAAWSLHTLDGVVVDTDGQPRTVSLTELSPYVKEWEAALRWSVSGGDARAGLRLAAALDPWWREHGGARAGRDLLYRLYGRLEGAEVTPGELASAYLLHAGLSGDRDERDRFLQRAEEAARRADDPVLLVRALAGHRVSLIEAGRLDDAELLCREVIRAAERTGAPAAALPTIIALAELLWRRDALDEAAELLGGARVMEATRPEDRGRRTVDWLLGMVALRRGDLVAAHDHLVVALRSRLRHGFRGAAADAVAAIAVRCAMGGDPVSASVLFGGAESVRGARRATQFGVFWGNQQGVLRQLLGDAAFDAAYADGAQMGFTSAVATALAVEHPDLEHGSARFAQTLG
ncbi:adenylate/guanylate cyclase domain-containing protein [Couchioplanes caeruleus]|uniref:adenylate/guanylate cyclase domain-containing protein n=1 Tax=Couchioplanes caeruleus TaxID=56438 RepID=UPI0020C09032|nr:adenylate/guanylate cyclase domain-containing protein [Couchioplanes caeruleus]UQU65474.1 adenylate/guanylate cyclase domain-containing protein [Couchioplanes caeruleus]